MLSLLFLIPVLLVVSLVYGLGAALFLRLGLSILNEPTPTFRRAVLIGICSLWLQSIFGGLLRAVGLTPVFYLISVPLAALLYQKMLDLRFSRAVMLALTQLLVLALGAVAIGFTVYLCDPTAFGV